MIRDIIHVLSVLLLLAGMPCAGASADNINYYFHQLTINKGLSQSTVTSILSGTDGMIWIGTSSGLNLFDRHQMISFFYEKDTPLSLPGNYIFFVTEDKNENIWVSTNKGLVRYHRNDNTFQSAIPEQTIHVHSFYSQADAIYFGGDNRLYKYVFNENRMEHIPLKIGTTPFEVNFIVPLNQRELLLISRDSEQFIRYNLTEHTAQELSFPDKLPNIRSVHLDKNGNLYMAPYKNGLYCYDKSMKKKFHLSTDNSALTNNIILSMVEKKNELWLATDGGGINVLNLDDLSLFSIRHVPGDIASMPVNSITHLYKDSQDNIFAGSVRGGMFGIKQTFIKTYQDVPFNTPHGLTEKAVISLYEEENGILWIGTDGGGVNRYDPATDHFTHYSSMPHGKVVSITGFSATELLVSIFSDRTYLFNKQTGRCTPFDVVNSKITYQQCATDFVELAFKLSENRIYFLSLTPYVYDINTKTFFELKTKEDPSFLRALIPVYADKREAYFIKNKASRLFKVAQDGDSLSSVLHLKDEIITAACRDELGNFWIGTDCGLSHFNPKSKELRKIDTQLFNNVSTLLYEGQGRLWIGAQNMLFSYDIQRKKFILWGESDGFPLNELPYTYQEPPKKQNIYLGGVSGLARINRDISYKDETLPQIKLVDVLVDGKSIISHISAKKAEITIPWNHSSLVIKVLSIEKDIFRKKLFRYTLVGENRNQIVTYDHTLALQTLPPGSYDIEVSCNAKNGDWSASQQVLHLIITPPWYKSPEIWLALLFLMIGAVVWATLTFVKQKEKKMLWTMSVHEQKMSKERIQFLVNISHELRTPLTLVYAPLKRILDKKEWELPNNNMQGNLLGIYKQVHHMKELINIVLDLNKMNDDKDALHKFPQHINPWLHSVVDDFRLEFEQRSMTLLIALDDKNPVVNLDSLKCTFVLSNLLMNALKFSAPNTSITLSSKVIDDKIHISVADQGIGLKNVDLKRLFTRYYQGEHNKPGSGIGLSYAKALMEKHGGTIGAKDNIHQGAVFYIEFPLDATLKASLLTNTVRMADNNNATCPEIDIENKDFKRFNLSEYTVLVVEDNIELLEFIKQSLLNTFKKVYTASNGLQALPIIKDKLPDIVVSDVMMPQMNGFELCRKIKEDIATSHIPIVLLTARNDSDSLNIGYTQGADTYLSKPFEEELLITVIVNQLRNREVLRKKYRESGFNSQLQPVSVNNLDEEFIHKLNKLINDNIGLKQLDVKFLTENMAMSRTPLFMKLKALTNMSINDYIKTIRIEIASQLLQTTAMSIADVSDAVGLESSKYFSTLFKQVKGVTPSQFREGTKSE